MTNSCDGRRDRAASRDPRSASIGSMDSARREHEIEIVGSVQETAARHVNSPPWPWSSGPSSPPGLAEGQ
ncbi:hypothetical protein [Streptomyces sp. NBC_00055]|uniref:hypothetical protein n=1 Tax=Streptomyces sp. NBC_00055 TaxID=2975632 RepID=UPI0032481C43